MIGTKRLREIERSLGDDCRAIAEDTRDLCAEVRRLVKALADIRKHHRVSAGSFYGQSALTAMIDRALEGYEVDDA